MKSGLISAIWTARAYKELGIDPGRKLVFISMETRRREAMNPRTLSADWQKTPGRPWSASPVWETGILRQEEREI